MRSLGKGGNNKKKSMYGNGEKTNVYSLEVSMFGYEEKSLNIADGLLKSMLTEKKIVSG